MPDYVTELLQKRRPQQQNELVESEILSTRIAFSKMPDHLPEPIGFARSITCSGVEPSNAWLGCCNQSPIALALMRPASASNNRVTSLIFCTLERCGGVPAFQYETVLGDAPVTRLTASFDKL